MKSDFTTVDDLLDAEGKEIGSSEWYEIDQATVDTFADVVADHQWIHVDTERASKGPYQGTIAHGMLTLSLIPTMIGEVVTVERLGMGLNYGFDKVRFIRPVPVGSRVRGTVTAVKATPVDGGVRVSFAVVVEREGGEDPVCAAENVLIYLRPEDETGG